MTTLVYDGTFKGWLTAVFEVFEYKFTDGVIQPEHRYQEELLSRKHIVLTDEVKSSRVWKGLGQKVSQPTLRAFYKTFLSEQPALENQLLAFVQYVFASKISVEHDFGHPSVLYVHQMAKKVHREKHRMEAFVRFQLTQDQLYYAIVQPDFNVLPLIQKHFRERYADQRWLIYDTARRYGIYYDLIQVSEVNIDFSIGAGPEGRHAVYDDREPLFQELWQQYFNSVNIKARKNSRLHIQHMPRRYWKNLIEKQV
ncbi:MAG: DNA metabolism protein [Sphingobacteriaceae bacterium]|nr:MAG: DNA metabolism protein [Sphingobacteriaceae bacterium]